MDQWQQLFNEFVDGVSREVEHFVAQVFETADALSDLTEDTLEEVEKLVVAELERTFPLFGNDAFWAEFWDAEEGDSSLDPFNNFYGVEPMTNQPQACQGCTHFHGRVYNGTPFVCAMHPYGPDAEQCQDWSQGH